MAPSEPPRGPPVRASSATRAGEAGTTAPGARLLVVGRPLPRRGSLPDLGASPFPLAISAMAQALSTRAVRWTDAKALRRCGARRLARRIAGLREGAGPHF